MFRFQDNTDERRQGYRIGNQDEMMFFVYFYWETLIQMLHLFLKINEISFHSKYTM